MLRASIRIFSHCSRNGQIQRITNWKLLPSAEVQRWQKLSGAKATLEGDGRTFEAIAAERLKVAA